MSWLDDSVEEHELASQAQGIEFTNELPAPGFFAGSLNALGSGLVRGGIEGINSVQSLFTQAAGADQAMSLGLSGMVLDGQDAEEQRRKVEDETEQAAKDIGKQTAQAVSLLRPDPTTTGMAGQVLHEAAAILPRTVLGTVAAGPVGGAVAAGAPAGYSSKQEAMADGIDETTATLKGLIDAGTTGVGVVLPAARFVKPILGDAAIAVGANVGLGMVGRGSTAALLESNGYSAQAAQYRVMDRTALLTDAVLGAAFFGLGRASVRRPNTQQIDAALTERQAVHADIDTAPGAPTTPRAAVAHQDALRMATEQVTRGEPVSLPDSIHTVDFLRSADDSPLVARSREALTEQEAVHAREEFAARVGRESAYDDVGAPTFADGTAYPLREVVRFFDQHIAGTQPKDGTAMPDVLFQIGEVSDQVAQGLHDFLPGFHDGLREARITSRVLKHIQDSRPAIVRDVLERLEAGVLAADEVLPNPKNKGRALLVLRDVGGAERAGAAKHQSTVIELSANGKGVDVVSAMTMPDRTLNNARAMKAEMEESRAGGLHSPSSLATEQARQPHAAAASEDSPTVARDVEASIPPEGAGATDPEVQLAQMVIDQAGDVQVPTGAIDADGNPVTVSARQMLAEADADILRAEQESNGFAAAAACFLQRGA